MLINEHHAYKLAPAPNDCQEPKRHQFSDGFSTLSINITSTRALVDSSFNPSCSWNAVKSPGSAPPLSTARCPASPAGCNASGVHFIAKSYRAEPNPV